MRAKRLLRLAFLGLTAAVVPASGQEQGGGNGDCAAFERIEAEGRAQVERRLAAVDDAALRSDAAGFCAASADLLFVYRSLSAGARACGPERAAKWADAEAQTSQALTQVCQ